MMHHQLQKLGPSQNIHKRTASRSLHNLIFDFLSDNGKMPFNLKSLRPLLITDEE